ncbi:MAG: DUF1080 domain-containing protein [Rhodothermaceae bacterium]|nr:DUF1080 domain-containing protein [Rhodothermaceae bacterium]MYF63674.1 DUF1080 domain-containing protein [Rhodothermaceae bacterium]MYI84874.1 DUF1080 domain-containing protein [Rhodothermaceae bacterium]
MVMRYFLAATFAAATLVSCQSASENASSAEADDEEPAMSEEMPWQSLGADQWRRYGGEGIPEAWQISDDGVFHFTGEGEGGDIITVEQYDNFELELEWKISPAGNSGIMFRVSEDHDYPWRTGPEYQILDNDLHPDAQEGEDRHAGANYDMHPPSANVVSLVGEWNMTRIVANGAHVEHWLNGERIVSYELWSDDWKALIAESKWIDMPDYGMTKTGHICLQDHSDPVWFRNIRIRRLPGPESGQT